MDLNKLRQDREAIIAQMVEVTNIEPANWTSDNQATLNGFKTQLENVEMIIRERKDLFEKQSKEYDTKNIDKQLGEGNNEQVMNAFTKYLQGGKTNLNDNDRAVLENAQSTTSTEGGYTIPRFLATTISQALKVYGGVRQTGATSLMTSSGTPIDFPTHNGTSEVGRLVAEGATANDVQTVFGTIASLVYKFTSDVIPVTHELMADSAFNIASYIQDHMVTKIGRAQAGYLATGTGSAQPQGIVTAATLGKTGTTGQTTSVTYADLVDLEHSLEPLYRNGAKWVMNDSTFRALKKLVDSTGRPLLIGDDMGLGNAFEYRLLGYPVIICNEMAVMAANAKSILFGNFSSFIIRDVNWYPTSVYTDSVYDKVGQVGFNSWARMGSVLTDVGSPIRFYQNSAT